MPEAITGIRKPTYWNGSISDVNGWSGWTLNRKVTGEPGIPRQKSMPPTAVSWRNATPSDTWNTWWPICFAYLPRLYNKKLEKINRIQWIILKIWYTIHHWRTKLPGSVQVNESKALPVNKEEKSGAASAAKSLCMILLILMILACLGEVTQGVTKTD